MAVLKCVTKSTCATADRWLWYAVAAWTCHQPDWTSSPQRHDQNRRKTASPSTAPCQNAIADAQLQHNVITSYCPGGGETICSPTMAVRLAADLHPSTDRSAVCTWVSCRQPECLQPRAAAPMGQTDRRVTVSLNVPLWWEA